MEKFDKKLLVEELVKLKANFRRSMDIKAAVSLLMEEFPTWRIETFMAVLKKLRERDFYPENLRNAMWSIYYNEIRTDIKEEPEKYEWSPMPNKVKKWWKDYIDGKTRTLEDGIKTLEDDVEEELPF
jgi:hypothetical protein